ncbi:MAG: hypothetical protein A3K19_33385 [Lentisphaerae bacterium RIFOXYB12_FULL_65_16]|nr:MAG: hypothetical protein A3K18_05870 [Lentisphaerae bacterium RIFOXYA12_64_32]OGV86924.1 MAG: hypothetical protein A3K19_33385 [Lentisphaerae bacterium RIFOXYB12_FULL_65_16]
MTLRAVLLGLLGAAFICGFTYFNDAIMRQGMFVGNHMPIGVYGTLLLFLLIVNPLLHGVSNRFKGCGRWLSPLSARELAVVLALSLASCCVPYSSMLRLLSNIVMLPHHYVRTEAGWTWKEPNGQMRAVVDYLPARMQPELSEGSGNALDGFVQGLRTGSEPIRFSQIPWRAWVRPLSFWLPLILVLCAALTGLAVAVHRQWSEFEHLPYPIIAFTESLLPEEGRVRSAIFSNRMFWIGTVGVLIFHANNYACEWFPDFLIPIQRVLNFSALHTLFPTFVKGGGWSLLYPKIYFAPIGIAFLLATDVSMAVALGPFIFCYVGGLLAAGGITMGAGTYFAPRIDKSIVFGGYVGMFVAIAFTGRHYYMNLFRHALFLPSREAIGINSVWGARVFMAGMLVFIGDLCFVGLDWQLATAYSVLTVIIFLVMGRIIAETGLFFIAPYIYPCVLIYSFLGAQSVGPHALMIMFTLTCVLLIDPRETLLPYLTNSMKLVDDCRVSLGRTAILCMVAVILGLAIAMPVTLYFQYDRGVNWGDYWASQMAPKFAATETVRISQRLIAQDTLEYADSVHGWQRFARFAPDKPGMIAFFAGLAGVLLFVAGRLRFAWWPLHPVLFLVWSGYAGYMMAWAFLIGAGVKVVTTKYGGSEAYQRVKPLMFGLIAGDMLAGIGITIIGLFMYWWTGELPKPYWVLPG